MARLCLLEPLLPQSCFREISSCLPPRTDSPLRLQVKLSLDIPFYRTRRLFVGAEIVHRVRFELPCLTSTKLRAQLREQMVGFVRGASLEEYTRELHDGALANQKIPKWIEIGVH